MAADGISSLEPVAGLFLRPDAVGSGNPASKSLFVEGARQQVLSMREAQLLLTASLSCRRGREASRDGVRCARNCRRMATRKIESSYWTGAQRLRVHSHHSLCSATAEPYGTQRPLRMVYDELRARMVQRRQTAVLSTLKRHVLGVLTGVNERTV